MTPGADPPGEPTAQAQSRQRLQPSPRLCARERAAASCGQDHSAVRVPRRVAENRDEVAGRPAPAAARGTPEGQIGHAHVAHSLCAPDGPLVDAILAADCKVPARRSGSRPTTALKRTYNCASGEYCRSGGLPGGRPPARCARAGALAHPSGPTIASSANAIRAVDELPRPGTPR